MDHWTTTGVTLRINQKVKQKVESLLRYKLCNSVRCVGRSWENYSAFTSLAELVKTCFWTCTQVQHYRTYLYLHTNWEQAYDLANPPVRNPPSPWRCGPTRAMASSFLRFLDHTQRRITVGRTSLDGWSARRRDLYLATHNTQHRQTSMPSAGFEPTISASERP